MDRAFNIKINKERYKKEYWIDRLGKVHRLNGDLSEEYVSFHNEIADMLYPGNNRATDILFDLGWIMVGSVVYGHPIIHRRATQAQINKLDKLGLYTSLKYPYNGFYISYDENQVIIN